MKTPIDTIEDLQEFIVKNTEEKTQHKKGVRWIFLQTSEGPISIDHAEIDEDGDMILYSDGDI